MQRIFSPTGDDPCTKYHHQVGCSAFGQCDELVFYHIVVVHLLQEILSNVNQSVLVFVFPFHNTIDPANGWGESMGRNMLERIMYDIFFLRN
jgi:hypothetical protein